MPSGIITLAINTMSARGQDPEVYRNTTPLMMVSESTDPRVVELSTGSTFAGMKQIAAAMTSAQVYWMEWWCRHESSPLQRGQ